MKFKIISFFIFGLGAMSFVIMLTQSLKTEDRLPGVWKEIAWEYEGDAIKKDSANYWQELQALKNHLGQDFSVHRDEHWIFLPDGRLNVTGADHVQKQNLRWTLKGRGDMLVFKDGRGFRESYNITELTDDRMVLNFNVDLQARGVAKLTFEKIK